MSELSQTWPDLRALQALGFGPDAALMNEPKLFVDRRFLGALLQQLTQELGEDGAAGALFQIGLLHGLRDAMRIVESVLPCQDGVGDLLHGGMTPLAIRLGTRRAGGPGRLQFCGSWPECYEADARLSKLGPTEAPCCQLSAGYTSGWLSGTLDANLLVMEERCLAARDGACRFTAREVEAWRSSDNEAARALAEVVDFELLRETAARSLPAPTAAVIPEEVLEEIGDFDRDAPVVHVWGPVLVIPFTSGEEAIETLDVLSRDATSTTVRAVVVDLRDAILDELHDATALDQVLQTVEAWGAEALLTGVSPMSEDVVRDLEATHLVIRKDLTEAIAAAFQIADAQRHLL